MCNTFFSHLAVVGLSKMIAIQKFGSRSISQEVTIIVTSLCELKLPAIKKTKFCLILK